MVTKNLIQSLIWLLDQLDEHRFILDAIQIELVKKALDIFEKLDTKGYEHQLKRLKKYIFSEEFSDNNPLLNPVYLYDDEIEIIIMGLEELKEEAAE